MPNSGGIHSASIVFPYGEDGVVQVDCAGSENQEHPSSDVGGVEKWLGITSCEKESRSVESSCIRGICTYIGFHSY